MISQQFIRPQSQITTPKRASKMASGQSLNHLLNFTLPPRQSQQPQSLPRRSRKNGTNHGVWNKESKDAACRMLCGSLIHMFPGFVNAQYRFVMNPTGDYTVHFADPDMYVCIGTFSRYTIISYGRAASFNGRTYCKS